MHTRFFLAFPVVTALATASCSAPIAPVNTAVTDPALATYAKKLNIDISTFRKTESGLYVKDVPVGWGTAADSGNTVSVDYVGYYTNGVIFDSNRNAGNNTYSFTLGEKKVIAAWEEGVRGMRVGGKRRLVVPPALGYGVIGNGNIPPNTILVFDITLHGVR